MQPSSPHICHITTAHTAFDTRIFRRQCVSLARAGFRVSLVCRHARQEVVDGVHLVPLPEPASAFDRLLFLPKHAADVAQGLDADLYQFHDPELVPHMRRLARASDRPVIWDAHENYVSTIAHFNSFRFKPVSWLASHWFDRMEMRACRSSFAGVVTITEQMAERYRRHGVLTCVLGNYADTEAIKYPPGLARSVRPRLISTGAQFADRGVLEIAEAFAQIRHEIDAEVAFWGTFDPPSLAQKLTEAATRRGAPASDVITGGPFPWQTLVEELIPTGWVGCVLFNPMDKNNLIGLPNRFFEYWSNAVPVIATAGTEVARTVLEVGGGLVVRENNPGEIAQAFLTLARQPSLVNQMGAAGRRAVEDKYNWGAAFRNLLEFYAQFSIKLPEGVGVRPCAE